MSRFDGMASNKLHLKHMFPLLMGMSTIAFYFAACATSTSTSGPIIVELFYHSGQEAERTALATTLQLFNNSHPNIQVDAVQLPEASYICKVPFYQVRTTPRRMMLERGAHSHWAKNAWALENGRESGYD